MNIITSPTPAAEYLRSVKENMGGHFSFGQERFTGLFLGKWFHITHHAGYSWNERYTNQKNAAVGYVKRTESGCEVRFLTFKGLLCPAQFLSFIPFSYLLMVLYLLFNGVMAPSMWTISLVVPGVMAISAAIGTLFESMTPRSEEGKRILYAMLLDPEDPFSYINNSNQIPF